MEGVEEMEVRPPPNHADTEGCLTEAERPSKRRERQGKSPRRRRDIKRRPDDQEHLLRRRLPGQAEHPESAASIVDTAEGSPKRWDRHIQDPASQRLTWNKPPVNVLVIRKIRDETLLQPFKELCRFLIQEKQLVVYVEKKAVEEAALLKDETFGSIRNQLVPPVMAFHLGSLGFLTPFKFESYKTEVAKVFEALCLCCCASIGYAQHSHLLDNTGTDNLQRRTIKENVCPAACTVGNAAITLRSRLKVKVVKDMTQRTGQLFGEENGVDPQTRSENEAGKVTLQLQVLNEVVVDRGPSSYLSNVDLYLDGRLITSVQGDGVIVSTPTGSTAYAAAAGASMIHPNVPAIMVTPICPHSLSFRPIVVPAGVELMITLSPEARNTAWVSFDGRKRQEIQHGDSIKITTSCYPVPSICCHDLVYDWFESLAECLHWNVRKKQTRLTDVTDSSDAES
ncbi:hypothetical protein JZ751_018649 [Albula glossodonta]|uniref:NAD(+) kinase n=1 Tax=Albula glossodonta TaxID=121402 RepID=A0A8T2MWP7_9TELE|nr:hypothetical protein JZ751_018649 [Albula glossodonta]